MQEVVLKTSKRQLYGKALKAVRSQGLVPGVVYGQGKDATSIQADERALDKAYHQAGTSKLVELNIEGEDKPKNVLFHDVQLDPITDKILHFDFYTVRMDEKIKTEVPLHFEGEAPAVYNLNAMLLQPLESVEIEALPKDLPENITVDLNGLEEVGQEITVGDLNIPSGVTVLNDPDQLVAKTEAEREEEEEPEIEVSEEELVAQVEAEKGGAADDATDDDKTDDSKGDKQTGEPAKDGKPPAESAKEAKQPAEDK